MSAIEELEKAVLALPVEQRAWLAESLLSSLPPLSDPEFIYGILDGRIERPCHRRPQEREARARRAREGLQSSRHRESPRDADM